MLNAFQHHERVLDQRLAVSGIPDRLHDGLRNYLVYGYRPGSFLRAVLENDLITAVVRADEESATRIAAVVRFLWNYAPSEAWGSPDRVQTWLDARALERKES